MEGCKIYFCEGEICRIIKQVQPFGIGAAVRYDDYRDLYLSGRWHIGIKPYVFCLDFCLEALIHRLHEVPVDEGILIYIDEDEGHETATALKAWHQAVLQGNLDARNPDREFHITTGLSTQFRPLEAADILANESSQYMKTGADNLFLGAHPVEGTDPYARPIIERLKEESYINVWCFTKQILEMELEARSLKYTTPSGHLPGESQ